MSYNPNQPRVPSGGEDGGQWTSGAGSLDPAEMTPSQVNKELEKLAKKGSELNSELIARGMGNMKFSEIRILSDNLSKAYVENAVRATKLRDEITIRTGQKMFAMPEGFKRRRKFGAKVNGY
jgi:hypothetical protein